MTELPSERLERATESHEEGAKTNRAAANFFGCLALAGLVGLGIGVANRNQEIELLGLGIGAAVPAVLTLGRARRESELADGYRAEAATARNQEAIGFTDAGVLAAQMAEVLDERLATIELRLRPSEPVEGGRGEGQAAADHQGGVLSEQQDNPSTHEDDVV